MEYKYILFDLDGTISDPKVGITKSIQYALNKMGITEELDNLVRFIGPPLKDELKKYYGFDEEAAWKAITYYREYFSTKGLYENILYEGIADLVKALHDKKHVLYVATSKPTLFSKKIITHFGLEPYFREVIGADLELKKASKIDLINQVLELHPEIDKRHIVMIGDREHDVIGAQKAGIDSIAVGFGYGSADELNSAQPTHYVRTVKELSDLLLRS